MKERYVKVNACSFKLQCFDVGFFGHVSSQEVHDLLFSWQFRWQLCRFSKFHLAVHLTKAVVFCFINVYCCIRNVQHSSYASSHKLLDYKKN